MGLPPSGGGGQFVNVIGPIVERLRVEIRVVGPHDRMRLIVDARKVDGVDKPFATELIETVRGSGYRIDAL